MEDGEKERIKNSFLKVREDIDGLKVEINELKGIIKEFTRNIDSREKPPPSKSNVPSAPQETVSIGNEGVYSNIHSFIHSFNRHSTDTKHLNTSFQEQKPTFLKELNDLGQNSLKQPTKWSLSNLNQIDNLFLTLTKQEFSCFMVIFQLEEEVNRGISYSELSQSMSLSEGCMRTYVSQMIKKGIPLKKIRVNNKLTLLIINKEFRSLNLKQRLLSLLSKSDPTQTTLL